ncbi:MAG: CHAT domain-containing protein, partial [Blastocatellia bacterium]
MLLIGLWLAPKPPVAGKVGAINPHSTPATQDEKDARRLEPRKSVEREIVHNGVHAYIIDLEAGHYVHIAIIQRGIDLSVAINAPDGQMLAKYDDFQRGAEMISLIASASGNYRIEVRSGEIKPAAGRYEISVSELRVATLQDQQRLATEQNARQLVTDGRRLFTKGSKDDLQSAIEKYEQALPLWRATGNQRMEARTLNLTGLAYDNSNDKQKALSYHQQSLPLWRAAGDRPSLGVALVNTGGIYLILLRRSEATDLLQEALPLVRESDNRTLEAATLVQLGGAYVLTEPQKALEYLDQALPIWREVGERFGEAQTIQLVGAAYFALGEKEKAAEYFSRSAEMMKAGATLPGKLSEYEEKLLAANRIFSEAGRLATQTDATTRQRAIEKYEEALPLWRSLPDRQMEAATLMAIGSVYSLRNEPRQAIERLNQALVIWRAAGSRHGEEVALMALAEAWHMLNDQQQASDRLDQAQRIGREIGDRSGLTEMLYLRARILRARNQPEEALARIEEAIELYESLRVEIPNPHWRATYHGSKHRLYELCIDLLMQLRRQHPAAGYEARAIKMSERARARSLLDLLTQAHGEIRGNLAWNLLERQTQLRRQLYAKERARIEVLFDPSKSGQVKTANQEIETILRQFQELDEQIRQHSPHYYDLTRAQPLDLPEIQRQAIDAQTLLLEYALGEERSYLWAVTPNSIASFELPNRTEIEAAARRVYGLLTERNLCVPGETDQQREARIVRADAQYVEAAAGLSRMLLGPVAAQLGNKRLLIVADGALQYVPFAALPEPGAGGWGLGTGKKIPQSPIPNPQPLIVNHEVISLPSASTLAVLRRELEGRQPAPKALAVLADPVVDKNDERLNPQLAQASRRSTSRGRQSPACDASAKPGEWSRLFYSGVEADRIASFLPPRETLKALGFQADRKLATSDELSQYRIVHFSTHGKADTERPELSLLVFSLFDKQKAEQDGYLRAHEIYNLKLPAELVVLSACETGLGK